MLGRYCLSVCVRIALSNIISAHTFPNTALITNDENRGRSRRIQAFQKICRSESCGLPFPSKRLKLASISSITFCEKFTCETINLDRKYVRAGHHYIKDQSATQAILRELIASADRAGKPSKTFELFSR